MKDPDQVIPFERLPPGFAEMVSNPPERPVEPRPAATIVLLRDGRAGLEVLLMRRHRRAGFVPGAYVFPGGRVDGTDAAPPAIALLEGLTPADADARLELSGADPPAIAYYLAALREAFEETGILLGARADGGYPPTAFADVTLDALRREVMDDRVTFADAVERVGCRIDGRAIEYLAHWITPLPEPRRYDTRFFAARVPQDAEPIVDEREMTDALWTTPAAALSGFEDGSIPMVFPTIKTLEQLSGYADADDALAGIASTSVRTILPTLVVTRSGVGLRVDSEE
jgi:8-oxo-dGTP pyrophosphatase MutT (NUDIX family)